MLPFLIGDALKIAAAVPVARALCRVIHGPAASNEPGCMDFTGRAGTRPKPHRTTR
jgi:hypothetical protein